MAETKVGYVYILTNPSFKEDWVKIGKSARPVDVRSKELNNTAVPLPFEIYAAIKTSKFNEVEKLVHKTIDRLTDLRIRQNREFFNVPPQVAFDIFKDIASAIEDAELIEYKKMNLESAGDNSDECPHARRGRFKFSMVGIKIGEKSRSFRRGLPLRLQATILLNTTGAFTSFRRLSELLCLPTDATRQVCIRGQNSFPTTAKF